jgi:hypothetical protein
MKTLMSIVVLSLALGVGPAFAGGAAEESGAAAGGAAAAKSEADCQKAGGVWNAETNACAEKPQ